jgi:hypothetical protein
MQNSSRETDMKRTTVPVIVVLALLAAALPARAQMGPPVLQSVLRIETHSDSNNPDDYVYKMISLSRQLEGGVIGNVFYVYKHNLEESNSGGHIAGVNIIKMFSDETMFMFGYSYNKTDERSLGADNYDKDRWVLGLHYFPIKDERGNRLTLSSVYNTQTDWSESRAIDFGIAYKAVFSDDWSARMGYKYTHGLGAVDTHLLNQWNIDFSWKLNKLMTLDFGYLFVDKVFSVPAPGAQPEDDNVFRMGLKYSYK